MVWTGLEAGQTMDCVQDFIWTSRGLWTKGLGPSGVLSRKTRLPKGILSDTIKLSAYSIVERMS